MREREIELIDYLYVLWRWRWLIVLGTLACVAVVGLATALLPRVYRVGATVETGDVAERDVERFITRVSAGPVAQAATGPGKITASFRKPFLIELSLESESPGEAVGLVHGAAARIVEDLNGLLKVQNEEDEAKLNGLRTRMEAVQHEVRGLVGQLRATSEQRIQTIGQDLEFDKARRDRLQEHRALLERHVRELTRALADLERARSGVLRGTADRVDALVLMQLANEMAEKERLLVDLERQLRVGMPEFAQELAWTEQRLRARLQELKRVIAVLADPAFRSGDPQYVEKVRDAVSRLVATGSDEVLKLEPTLRKLSVELPEKLRTLQEQASALGRKSAVIRPARVLYSPEVPRRPIKPRTTMNLVSGFVVGLLGSSVLALFLEYLRQAGERRRAGAPVGSNQARSGDPTA